MKNKILPIAIISIVLLLLIVGLIAYLGVFSGSSEKFYFLDKELGLISITLSKSSVSPTQQASFSAPLSVQIGTKTTINSYVYSVITDCKKFTPKAWILEIYKDNSLVTSIDLSSKVKCGFEGVIKTTFTPTSSGKYTADDTFMYYNINNKLQTTVFESNNVLVVVDSSSQVCKKNNYFGAWSTINELEGGVIQERTFYKVTSDCEYKENNQESRIVCSDGYTVSGTSSTIADYIGNNYCELISIPEETTEEVMSGDTEYSECNSDLTESCEDGTEVTLKFCSDGELTDTGSTCSVVNNIENEEDNQIQDGETDEEIKIDGNCTSFWCEESIPGISNLSLIVILSSVVVTFLIVVILIVVFSRRK